MKNKKNSINFSPKGITTWLLHRAQPPTLGSLRTESFRVHRTAPHYAMFIEQVIVLARFLYVGFRGIASMQGRVFDGENAGQMVKSRVKRRDFWKTWAQDGRGWRYRANQIQILCPSCSKRFASRICNFEHPEQYILKNSETRIVLTLYSDLLVRSPYKQLTAQYNDLFFS